MKPEGKVRKELREYAKELGPDLVYRCPIVASTIGKNGAPDELWCVRGVFVGIEAKSGDRKPTKLQEANLIAIEETGGYAVVVRESNMKAFKQWIKDLIEASWLRERTWVKPHESLWSSSDD
jgi:hypothetical protein